MMTPFLRTFYTLVVMGLLSGPLAAQQNNPRPEQFRDWRLIRDGDRCVATVDVGLRAPSSGLVTLAIFERTAAGASDIPAVMTLRVPVGAALSEPPVYTHAGGGEAVGLAWQSCGAFTCMASGGISLTEVQKLKDGQRIFIAFRPLLGSRPLIVPVSLLGITKALNALKRCD